MAGYPVRYETHDATLHVQGQNLLSLARVEGGAVSDQGLESGECEGRGGGSVGQCGCSDCVVAVQVIFFFLDAYASQGQTMSHSE